jgi:hypothetical protein
MHALPDGVLAKINIPPPPYKGSNTQVKKVDHVVNLVKFVDAPLPGMSSVKGKMQSPPDFSGR